MSFSNRENECVVAVSTKSLVGWRKWIVDAFLFYISLFTKVKTTWLSRSAAVVSIIAIDSVVLMVKRGPGCPDAVGKWVLPCGYVDWDENLTNAAIREIYEETGVNIITLIDSVKSAPGIIISMNSFDGDGCPVFVRSAPNQDAKQNISNYMVLDIHSTADFNYALPDRDLSVVSSQEVSDVQWFTLTALAKMEESGVIGFSHYQKIKQFFG